MPPPPVPPRDAHGPLSDGPLSVGGPPVSIRQYSGVE